MNLYYKHVKTEKKQSSKLLLIFVLPFIDKYIAPSATCIQQKN